MSSKAMPEELKQAAKCLGQFQTAFESLKALGPAEQTYLLDRVHDMVDVVEPEIAPTNITGVGMVETGREPEAAGPVNPNLGGTDAPGLPVGGPGPD